jgi:mRNA interferase HigB
MRVITRRRLREFWEEHPDSADALRAWEAIMKATTYTKPSEVKEQFGSASMLGENVTVFNICGNRYRLVVTMRYDLERIYIRHVLTHAEYNDLTARGLL